MSEIRYYLAEEYLGCSIKELEKENVEEINIDRLTMQDTIWRTLLLGWYSEFGKKAYRYINKEEKELIKKVKSGEWVSRKRIYTFLDKYKDYAINHRTFSEKYDIR